MAKPLRALKKNSPVTLHKVAVTNPEEAKEMAQEARYTPGSYHKHIKTNHLPNGLYHHVYNWTPDARLRRIGLTRGRHFLHILSASPNPSDEGFARIDVDKSSFPELSEGGFTIAQSAVKPEYAGHGLGKQLYAAAVIHHGKLHSGTYVSPNAHEAWKSLKSNPMFNVRLDKYPTQYHNFDSRHMAESKSPNFEDHANMFPIIKSEDLEKMSQPRLQFPKVPGMDTRPDQDVRQIETERQKKIYGRVVAQNAMPDKEENYSTSEYNPETKEFINSPTVKRKVSRQTLRDKYAKRVTGGFSRNTLGRSAVAAGGGKSFNAALSGAQRTKFEGHEPSAEAKEKHAERHGEYHAKLKEWLKRADELKAEYNKQDNPNARLAAAHVYNQHIKTRPRRPRKATVGKKATKDLSPEQQIERGKNVDTTIEHEAAHGTWRQLEANAGKLEARDIKRKLVETIPQETLRHLASFVEKRGYKPKDAHFTEEILNHARDILTSPTKRKSFEAHVGAEKARAQVSAIKSAWKNIIAQAKAFSVAGKSVEQPTKLPEAAEKSEPLDKMGLHGNWANEGYTLRHEHYQDDNGGVVEPHIRITAHDKAGNLVGSARFQVWSNKTLYPVGPAVSPDHARKGLASAMYAHAEKITGHKVIPSDTQTDDAKAMWANPNRAFGKSTGYRYELDSSAENVKVHIYAGAEYWTTRTFIRDENVLRSMDIAKSDVGPEIMDEISNLVQNATGMPIG